MKPRKTLEDFIKEAKEVHHDLYDYSKVISYTNNHTKVCIICKDHGDFFQSYAKHVYRKFGCPKCKGKKNADRCRLSKEVLIEKFRLVHGDTYDYSLVDYDNYMKKIIIVCKEHGPFKQLPGNHLAGNGCPMCTNYKFSKPMKEIYNYLKSIGEPFETEKSFDGCRHILPLPFDFYLTDRKLCIEYDGEYHYVEKHGREVLEKVQLRDKIKNEYCSKNNIRLIRIPYWKKQEIKEMLFFLVDKH
jgi:hypothetical protein